MDRQLYDEEQQSRCRQFAAPISSPCDDVSLDGLSGPSLWSSQRPCRSSAWCPADSRCPLVSRDTFHPSDCRRRQRNEASQFYETDCLCRGHTAISTVRPTGVSDRLRTSNMSTELTASRRTKQTGCPRCQRAVGSEFEAGAQQRCRKLDHSGQSAGSYQDSRPTDCHPYGSGDADPWENYVRSVSLGKLRIAGDVEADYAEEGVFPVSHNFHCTRTGSPSSHLAEPSGECCDRHGAMAAKPPNHSRPQPRFTNCHQTSVMSFAVNSTGQCQKNSLCSRQTMSMNDLDDIDLPLHSSASVNCASTNMIGNAVSATRQSCFSPVSLPSSGSKLPLSGRKSKKKGQQNNELSPPVRKKTVCDSDQNLCRHNGAVENTLSSGTADHFDPTSIDVSIESGTDCRVTENANRKNSVHEQNGKLCESVPKSQSSPAECSEPKSTEPDSLKHEQDCLRHDPDFHICLDSRPRQEVPSGLRHHRRVLRKTLRAGPRQKSARHGDQEPAPTASATFHIRQFLESISWQRHQQNIG